MGLHTVEAVGIAPGDAVLVVGAGTVGLTSATWASLRGAERITMVDPNEVRRAGASAFGATDTLASAADVDPGAYDVAIECVGKPGLLDAWIAATRAKGRIVVAGVCTEQDPFWSMAALMKELIDPFRGLLHAGRVQDGDRGLRLGGHRAGPPGWAHDWTRLLGEAFDALSEGSTRGQNSDHARLKPARRGVLLVRWKLLGPLLAVFASGLDHLGPAGEAFGDLHVELALASELEHLDAFGTRCVGVGRAVRARRTPRPP